MVTAFFVSLAVIFVAELGDKSQLMALAFATRYRTTPVLIGIGLATAVVHAVSVGIGAALGATIPTRPVTIVAGIAFLAFGAWTLRGDKLTAEEERRAANQSNRSTIFTVGGVFFLAELGDKTMLATITLATREGDQISVLIGAKRVSESLIVASRLMIQRGGVRDRRPRSSGAALIVRD